MRRLTDVEITWQKSSERRTPISNPKHPATQDDIEIEVAEALFDLMKQSQSQPESQPQSSQRQEKTDRDRLNSASDGNFFFCVFSI